MCDELLEKKMHDGAAMFQDHVAMALIMEHTRGPEGALRNGTLSLIATGTTKLIITNAHVYDFYLETQRKLPGAAFVMSCGWGKQPINISTAHLIDRIRQDGVDLAVLEFDHTDLIEASGKRYYASGSWPPPRAEKGDVAFLIGFPELHRETSARGLEARMTPVCDFVTTSNDRHFMLVDENLERRVMKNNKHLVDFGSLSGMSGCPAFCQKSDETKWELVGFMYEASQDGQHSMICANHADFITTEGFIDRGRMPWIQP